MASANAYAGRFIGNDILSKPRQKQNNLYEPETYEPAVLQVPNLELAQAGSVTATALEVPRNWPGSRFLNLRSAGLLLALFMSGYLGLLTVTDMTRSSALSSISSTAYNLEHRINNNIHHIPTYVPLPSYTVAVRSNSLSSDIKNIEAQPIVINFSFASVSPSSAQLAQWVSTSAGPKAGTTLLSANINSIEDYLNSQVKLYDRSPVNEVDTVTASGNTQVSSSGTNGISYTGVSTVAKQLANKLLSANGVTASMTSTVIPYVRTTSS